MAAEHDIRRNGDGSIDMDFDKARGRDLRNAARRDILGQLSRAALNSLKILVRRGGRAAGSARRHARTA